MAPLIVADIVADVAHGIRAAPEDADVGPGPVSYEPDSGFCLTEVEECN
jgi:hypothetical protein